MSALCLFNRFTHKNVNNFCINLDIWHFLCMKYNPCMLFGKALKPMCWVTESGMLLKHMQEIWDIKFISLVGKWMLIHGLNNPNAKCGCMPACVLLCLSRIYFTAVYKLTAVSEFSTMLQCHHFNSELTISWPGHPSPGSSCSFSISASIHSMINYMF